MQVTLVKTPGTATAKSHYISNSNPLLRMSCLPVIGEGRDARKWR